MNTEEIKSLIMEQAPLIANEVLTRDYYSSLVGMGITFSILIGVGIFGLKIYSRTGGHRDDFLSECGFPIFGGVAMISCIIGFIINAYNLMNIVIYPRLYLIEYCASLVKPSGS